MSEIRLLSLVVSVAVLLGFSGYDPSLSRADDGADDEPPTWWLGLVARPLDAPLRAQTNLSDDRGLLVDSVTVDGPADKAGVEQYDVLIAVDDHEVGTANPVDDAWDVGSADAVRLQLLRRGDLVELTLTPEPAPDSTLDPEDAPPLHGVRHAYLDQLGIDLKPISDAVRMQLPEPYTGGVEVAYVGGEPAHIAGFKAGDVIVGLEKWEIRDLKDVLWVLDTEGGFDRFYIARGDESGREVLFGSMELAGIPDSSPVGSTVLESQLEDLMRDRRDMITLIAEMELLMIESRLAAFQGAPSESEDLDALRRARHQYDELAGRKRAFEEELLVVETKIAYLKRHVGELNNE